jgi:RNA polymerase sigma factor (sigma-70 family)
MGVPERKTRTKASSSEALRVLGYVVEFQAAIRNTLFRYLRKSPSEIDDLYHDVYVRALCNTPDWSRIESIRAYLCQVAKSVAIDRYRRLQIVDIQYLADLTELRDDQHPVDGGADFEPSLEQELVILWSAALTLPPRRRACFLLRKVYGYSQKEIACIMHISQNTVEQHLMRAVREIVPFLGGAMYDATEEEAE